MMYGENNIKLYSLIKHSAMYKHREVEGTIPRFLISTPDEGHFTTARRATGSEASHAV